jgi:hypothetical protein
MSLHDNGNIPTSLSWSSLLDDDDVQPKQYEVLKKSNLFDSTRSVTSDTKQKDQDVDAILSISEILSLDILSITEDKLLFYQKYISGQIKKYVNICIDRNQSFDTSLHMEKLEWLCDVAQYLSEKYEMRKITHVKKYPGIPRTSYKFCTFGADCGFHYSKKKKCYGQHYVYNCLNADVEEVVKFIQSDNSVEGLSDVLTSMNTIIYVINHMYDEYTKVLQKNERDT